MVTLQVEMSNVFLENEGSSRLLEKVGMKFERMIMLPNDVEELMVYWVYFS